MNTEVHEEAFNHIITKRKLTEGLAGQLLYLAQAVKESNSRKKKTNGLYRPMFLSDVVLAIGNQ